MLTVEQVRKVLGKRAEDDDVGALLGEHPASVIDEDATNVVRLLREGFDRGAAAGADCDVEEDLVVLAVEEIEDLAAMIEVKPKVIAFMYGDAVREGRAAAAELAANAEAKPARKARQRKPVATAAT